jgi:hypothetical protein
VYASLLLLESNYIVACLLKARLMEPAETAVAREHLCKHSHCLVMATTDMHATIEKLLESVFSVQSVSRLYNDDQLLLPVSLSQEFSESSRESAGRQSVDSCW